MPGVGIGLQKNVDVALTDSGKLECISYHLGNPWSENVTAWIVVKDELSKFWSHNVPEEVEVPSGTFRYNSTCCLIPIKVCFQLPYVLELTPIKGRVFSAFRWERPEVPLGSVTGTSVAYSLEIRIRPITSLNLNPRQEKCLDFYLDGKIEERCFKAPWLVFSDYSELVELNGKNLRLNYKNNRMWIIGISLFFFFCLLIFLFRRFRILNRVF